MPSDREAEADYVFIEDVHDVERQAQRRRFVERADETADPWSYRAKIGRGILRLTTVEYRILKFLASRPYHVFTRHRIADAIRTASHPVTAETVGRHIASLRSQLGFYSDYIQSVPNVGYRFKA
jgi:DNA-binding response OmpR family regulator